MRTHVRLASLVMVGGLGLAGVLASGGCLAVAAGAGAGTYAYVTGSLKATLDRPLDKSYDASRAAVKSLGFTETTAASDALQGRVEATMADNTSVTIRLNRLSDASTEVVIRVGTFGDRARSIAIYDEIRKGL
jgi:hypothetical protein